MTRPSLNMEGLRMASEEEFQKYYDLAHEHAFAVQQAIRERARLCQLFRAVATAAQFRDGESLKATLGAIAPVEEMNSQFAQDIFCLLANQGKRGGYFVEFGACDGALLSNTLLLERDFGWTGIVAEPMPKWHAALEKNRNCIIEHRCVWTQSGVTVEFAEYEDDQYGTESSIRQEGPRATKSVYEVPTITLQDMLREHGAPKTIDFLSMDVEGGEFGVLSSFPFDE